MRDDDESRRANGVRPEGVRARPVPVDDIEGVRDPLDLVAVQADDELITALSAGLRVGPAGGADTDDRVAAILAAWKAEVDAEPVPELVDVDTAVAAVLAARPRRSPGRVRHLAPLAAAAAIVVMAAGGVSVGAHSADPGEPLFGVTEVLFRDVAQSKQAVVRAEEHIDRARQALVAGQPAVAERELARARGELAVIRPEEGRTELAEVQDFLMLKAQETPNGTSADLDAPLTTQPARPVPAGAAGPVEPSTSPDRATPDIIEDVPPVNPRVPASQPDVASGSVSTDPLTSDPVSPTTAPTAPTASTARPAPIVGPEVTVPQPGTTPPVPGTSTTTPRRKEGQAPTSVTGASTTTVAPTTS
ncbi:MAG TPA: anti-sigma-D factor RsdA [Pseudonocardia sp.]|nr:anti-sigma-D factor RsdA [Pseudonocardia sp.]